jgi:hypothetical protein
MNRRHAGLGQPIHKSASATQFAAHVNYAYGYFGRGQSKEFDNNPSTLWDKTQEVADKLVELKNLLIEYLPSHEVQPIILDC